MSNIKNLEVNYDMLSDEKKHDLYLRKLATGEIQGPPTGKPSQDKPWLKYYSEEAIVSDVPKMKAYDYLVLNNLDNLNSVAINYYGRKITYSSLIKKIDICAKALKKIGVKCGDIVTLPMANTPENIYLFYALNRIGAISNVIDPRGTVEEMSKEIKKTDSKYIIGLDLCCPTIERAISDTNVKSVVYLSAIESMFLPLKIIENIRSKGNYKFKLNPKFIKWNDFLNNGKSYNSKIDSEYFEKAPITLVHTGGSTGEPKSVILTNENFVSMAQMHKNGNLNYTKGERFLNILPPFIAYCLCNGMNMPLTLGLELSIIPKFELNEFPDLLEKYKPNHVLSGPILWDYVINSKIKDLSFLKTPVSGGDVLPIELEKRINTFFAEKNASTNVLQGYGMTEVSSAAVFSLPDATKEGSVGIPFVKNVVAVFNPDTNEELGYNEDGEIWISSPTIMLGYYNNNDETSRIKFIDENGIEWIRTSDIGSMNEDGNIIIKGRMKRIIVRSGNKIFPVNVENIILNNDNILQCAVVAKEDKSERHVPVVHIVVSELFDGNYDDLVLSICDEIKEKLPDFNVPVQFVFRNNMPVTTSNKIDFKELESEDIGNDYISVLTEQKKKIKF